MRRWGLLVASVVSACSVREAVGVYRLPIQTGDQEVSLKTMLARMEDGALVLFDAEAGREWARADARYAWDGSAEPFNLRQRPYPVVLHLRDGVLEDVDARPWATVPVRPLVPGGTRAARVTLRSGTESLVVWDAGGTLYTTGGAPQPADDDVARPLALLGSFATSGLLLPADLASASTWRDAMTTLVPPDASKPVVCGGPIVSTYRVVSASEKVVVPAGAFTAVRVSEVPDSCLMRSLRDVRVERVERWFAPGVGPVQLRYVARDGLPRIARLASMSPAPAGESLWPLEPGRRWVYEVAGPDGAVVDAAAEVVVERRDVVDFPE